MTPSAWLQYITGRFGPLPDSYFAFDVETSGLSLKNDVVLQLGWAMVDDRKLVDSGAVVLDWTRIGDAAWNGWLAEQIDKTKRNIETTRDGRPSGKKWNFHIDRVRAEGCHPVDAFAQFSALIADCRAGGFKFLGHYGLRCDQPMIDQACLELLGPGRGFELAPGEYYDTMALEKGIQLGLAVKPGEDQNAFIRRAYAAGGNKVHSSLDQHCAPKYRLAEKHNLNMNQAHEADFDAVLTHLLLEEFRGIMDGRSAAA